MAETKETNTSATQTAQPAAAAPAAAAPAAAPQKVKMKIKAKDKKEYVGVKVLIKHDMMTYDQAQKKTGSRDNANFITHITATVGDKIVYDASTSQFLSKNPMIKFKFKGGKKGDTLKITYTDLKGGVFFDEKKIK